MSEVGRSVLDVTDPLLLDETSCEEEAAWLEAVEAQQDEAQAFVRRVTALARGYVLAQRAGRGDLAVADVMGSFGYDRRSAEAALGEALQFAAHPDTLAALERRQVGLRHARALMDVLGELPSEVADAVERRVLSSLVAQPGRPPARVRELARREALRLDPEGAARRRQEAARGRSLRLRSVGDGMVELTLLVRAEQGLAVLHRAEQATAHDDGSGRTRDQRRADWAVERLLQDAPPPADGVGVLDGRRRRPVQVLVHVPVTTALNLDDEPCHLEEVGPVDAEHGRLLLATAELRKVCVDATTGQVVHVDDAVVRPVPDTQRVRDLGSTSRARAQATAEAVRAAVLAMVTTPSVAPVDAEPQYRPSAALARTVRARHPRCDFLTCSTPSRAADLEHDRPHDQGGPTSAGNLTPRSRWCHRAKQRGWSAGLLPDGTTVWHSPSGRTYPAQPQHAPPPPVRPGVRLQPPRPPLGRDDDGPPHGVGDPADEAPLDVTGPVPGSVLSPLPQPAVRRSWWPDDPGF
jgi:hypothetical protein